MGRGPLPGAPSRAQRQGSRVPVPGPALAEGAGSWEHPLLPCPVPHKETWGFFGGKSPRMWRKSPPCALCPGVVRCQQCGHSTSNVAAVPALRPRCQLSGRVRGLGGGQRAELSPRTLHPSSARSPAGPDPAPILLPPTRLFCPWGAFCPNYLYRRPKKILKTGIS